MRILSIVVTALLIFAIISGGFLWSQLNTTKNQLFVTTTQLATTEAELSATEIELVSTEGQLDVTKTQLTDTQYQLDNTKVKLSDTEAQLTNTKAQLSSTRSQLETTEVQLADVEIQLETAKDTQLHMSNQYSDLAGQIYLRFGQEQDSQGYITPDTQAIGDKVLEVTGGYTSGGNEIWTDYQRLYNWVVSNIEYSYDSYMPVLPEILGGGLTWRKECWKMPRETLEDKVGDCEDMATLLASMMLNYNNEGFDVWAIGIETQGPNGTGHLAVAFPVQGNELTILDPAGNYYTGINAGGLRSYDVTVAVNDWLSHWTRKMPGAEINLAFSNEFYRQFINSEDFVNWARK